MSEDDYLHGVDVGIDLYMDRAMKAEATATRRKEELEKCQEDFQRVLREKQRLEIKVGSLEELLMKLNNELAKELGDG